MLVIDGDMQLNLTLSYFTEDKALEIASGDKNLYCAIKEQKSLVDYIYKTEYEGIDIIPSSTLMSSVEFELFSKQPLTLRVKILFSLDDRLQSRSMKIPI